MDMLRAIFGDSKNLPSTGDDASDSAKPVLDARGQPISLTPSIFDAVFGEGTPGAMKQKRVKPAEGTNPVGPEII